jgi:hypothetical protein
MARKKAKKAIRKTKKTSKKTSKKSMTKRARTPARRTRKARKAGASTRISKAPSKGRARKATKKTVRRSGDVKGEGNYSASRRFRQKEESFIKRMGKKIAGLGQNARHAVEGSEGAELQAAEAESRERGQGMDQV